MDFQFEKRHALLSIGIGILILAPIVMIILPKYIVEYLYLYNSQTAMFVLLPSGTRILYLIAFVLSGVAFILMSLWKNKKMLGVGLATLLLSIILLFFSTLPYISIGYDGIHFREVLSVKEHRYQWEDIEEVLRYSDYNGPGFYGYEVIFHDGKKLRLADNKDFNHARGMFLKGIRGLELEIKVID